jgi:hypothetical protein
MSYLSSGPSSVEHGLGAQVIREDIITRGHIGVDFVPCELAGERVFASLTHLLNLGIHFLHGICCRCPGASVFVGPLGALLRAAVECSLIHEDVLVLSMSPRSLCCSAGPSGASKKKEPSLRWASGGH